MMRRSSKRPASKAELAAGVRRSILDAPAETERSLREAAFSGDPLPQPWSEVVTKVRKASYRVSDRDIEALRAGGQSENAILEITVAAAVGAASRLLEAGLAALNEE